MFKTFLITGGAGFIGSHFVRYIHQSYPRSQIINVDVLNYASNPEVLGVLTASERYRFVKEDINRAQSLYSYLEQADCVVHFAAQTHVDRSFDAVDQFIASNVNGAESLVEAALSCKNIQRFVHVSTDEVYGPIVDGYVTESAAFNPMNPYAQTKVKAETIVQAAIAKGLPGVIVRPSNNFGPNQHTEKFIPTIITNALNRSRVPVYGDGAYFREWLYVEDCVRAIDLVMTKGVLGQAYNIGSNNIWKNVDLVRHVLKLCDRPESLIAFVKDRPSHDRRYAMDCAKLEALGFTVRSDFDYCLLRTIDYYLENVMG